MIPLSMQLIWLYSTSLRSANSCMDIPFSFLNFLRLFPNFLISASALTYFFLRITCYFEQKLQYTLWQICHIRKIVLHLSHQTLILKLMKTKLSIVAAFVCVNAFAQVPSYVPTNGLVAWYSFNGNANDLSGNGNNGTVYGATLTADRYGNANSAYSFDGTSNYVSVTSNLNLPDSFTVSVWVEPYLKAAGNNASGYSASLVDKDRDQSGDAGYSLLYNDSTVNSGFYGAVGWSGNSSTQAVSGIDLTLHQWNHCVFTVSNGTGNLYLNDILVYTKTGLNPTSQNTDNLFFGKAVWGGNLFEGSLDDIGIWTRPLKQQEIASLYNATINDTTTVHDTVYAHISVSLARTSTPATVFASALSSLGQILFLSQSFLSLSNWVSVSCEQKSCIFIFNTAGDLASAKRVGGELSFPRALGL